MTLLCKVTPLLSFHNLLYIVQNIESVHPQEYVVDPFSRLTFACLVFERLDKGHQHTFLFHVDLQTLFEPTGLALITSRDVHNTVAIFFADVIQVPASQNKERSIMTNAFM